MVTAETLARWLIEDQNDAESMENVRDALTAAEAYVQGAGVPDTDGPLRDMAVRKLASYYYESRSPDERYGYPSPPPDLNALILQLRN